MVRELIQISFDVSFFGTRFILKTDQVRREVRLLMMSFKTNEDYRQVSPPDQSISI